MLGDLEPYPRQARVDESQALGCSPRDIDDPPAEAGPAIVDAQEDGASVAQVCDLHHCAEGQVSMSRSKAVHIEGFAARRGFSLEFLPIPTRPSDLPL